MATPPTRQRGFFGQPFALAHLFGVEMWERFSFYGMQGILIYYLYYSAGDGGLGISEAAATSIVGAYGGTVYLSTILGGWISDRLLGSERTLFYSAVMVMAGHIALSVIPGLAGVGVGLVLIAFGSGGVKATATSLVGDLYSADDVRRDAGFSIFYMGINVGALIGPLLTGWLQSEVGFHAGFALAAFGMAIGLVQYAFGRRELSETGKHPPNPLPAEGRRRAVVIGVVVIVLIAIASLTGLVTTTNMSSIVVTLTVIAAIGLFALMLASRSITDVERSRVYAFIPMFVASAAFWSLFQQQFTTVAVYSDQRLNRNLFGWEFPPTWVQSINPVFIILLAGVFATVWTKLGSRQPSSPIKFACGTIVMGLAFLAFIPMSGGGPNSAPLLGLIGILLLFTVAELFLSPVGLSLSTKLAPRVFHTQMVALFYLSVALGTSLAGTLAKYYDTENEVPYFLVVGIASIAIGVAVALGSRKIGELMRGVH
ncbi:peptide MFS transporter [Rhodococcus rhodnii]|uniref:Major facilitator superfamily (MFS) profile domain-containing protein n=2 Tax=Rhodococcus rhodnii TaxID=38312 RepID=R7WM33_9NOCA|nr:peptide MFS transporter [Rhodococcus rhodnii]EOM76320.1 hypothetical protein Rrhod_2321 [Rhodococcus rhodnii LMG 5362]TXG89994.1 peptide MFS transporter [Rhodococcus rhodnii]